MSVSELLNAVIKHDLLRSLQIFTPELILCVTIVILLLLRMTELHRRFPTHTVALFGSLLAFLGVFAQFVYVRVGPDENTVLKALFDVYHLTGDGMVTGQAYFSGLLMHDMFALFIRLGLSVFLVLMVALTILSGIPDNEDGQDFYTLLLGSTVGMMMAAGSNHLLMLFLSVEMMSVPSYAMVAFQKGRRQASEAALKYVVYGAGAAGVMLYGISLIAGLLGTGDLPLLAQRTLLVLNNGSFTAANPAVVTLSLGVLMVLAGLAFKLSLVPFHFWCPDAFEGATAEVCGFLSVASKGAAFALLVRFVLAFHGPEPALQQMGLVFGLTLGLISIVTTTYGNLAAYTQNNVKRMLAYSTIAHAGYMVMAISALLVILSSPTSPLLDASLCVEGLLYYLAVYLFMNLSAFAAVALVRNQTFREDIEGYNGLFHGNGSTKLLCVCMAISFFSLVGVPPLGGFFGKFAVFYSALQAGSVHWFLYVVLVVGGLNTVFSLFYYLRVLKAMFLADPPAESRPVALAGISGAYLALVTFPILALGATGLMSGLSTTARDVARTLLLH